eukprot:Sspe_Gene.19913::Locus_7282_Transcript_1_1_Confidence_1.000_Length_1875::g.19913::m.19913
MQGCQLLEVAVASYVVCRLHGGAIMRRTGSKVFRAARWGIPLLLVWEVALILKGQEEVECHEESHPGVNMSLPVGPKVSGGCADGPNSDPPATPPDESEKHSFSLTRIRGKSHTQIHICFRSFRWKLKDDQRDAKPPRRRPADHSTFNTKPPTRCSISRWVMQQFTLGGSIPVRDQFYVEDKPSQSPKKGVRLWYDPKRKSYIKSFTNGYIDKVFRELRRLLDNSTMSWKYRTNLHYAANELLFLSEAIRAFPVAGKRGYIPGSLEPVFELFALRAGAESVHVLDYIPLEVGYPRISTKLMADFWKEPEHFDFAISFSNFEHDGLGRYGDPINPVGDVDAMKETASILKPGGLLFLAVPVKYDIILWNAMRVYGRHLLARLLSGWTIVGVYGLPPDFLRGHLTRSTPSIQPIFVLQNTPPTNATYELCKLPGYCS